jgi:hypothetical protein
VVWVELPGTEHGWEMVHSPRTEHTINGVHRFLEWARATHVKKLAEIASGSEQSADD